jgi:predicted enzyme related to lactoylglutathione lyase
MPTRAKYVHTNLTARDWRRLVRFYCDVFGCVPKPPERAFSGDFLAGLTSLEAPRLSGMHLALPGYDGAGPTLEIFTYERMVPGSHPVANEPGFGHIAFLVDDVDASLAAVLAAGGGVVGKVSTSEVRDVGRLRVVYARDPEGNIVELQRWT